jgi:hypothetical protein
MKVDAAQGHPGQFDRLFHSRFARRRMVFSEFSSMKNSCMANLPECASGGDGILCRVLLPFGMERV